MKKSANDQRCGEKAALVNCGPPRAAAKCCGERPNRPLLSAGSSPRRASLSLQIREIHMRTCVVLMLTVLSMPAFGQSYWEHNGSIMALEASGASRTFSYQQPRSGLPVASGTVLFEGRRDGESYSGTAYLFSSRCGAIAYAVTGTVSPDERGVTMYGNAPSRDARCQVVGYKQDILQFNFLQAADQQRAGEQLTLGADAFAFHANLCGSGQATLTVYPPTQQVSADAKAMLDLARLTGVEVREADLPGNACALMHNNSRYILLGKLIPDKEIGDEDEVRGLDIVVLGHEIGHHVCGHASGRLAGQGWEKELEADRYGGMLLRQMFDQGLIAGWNDNPEEFLNVVANGMAADFYGVGGVTHPPADLRTQAIREGFYIGSNC